MLYLHLHLDGKVRRERQVHLAVNLIWLRRADLLGLGMDPTSVDGISLCLDDGDGMGG